MHSLCGALAQLGVTIPPGLRIFSRVTPRSFCPLLPIDFLAGQAKVSCRPGTSEQVSPSDLPSSRVSLSIGTAWFSRFLKRLLRRSLALSGLQFFVELRVLYRACQFSTLFLLIRHPERPFRRTVYPLYGTQIFFPHFPSLALVGDCFPPFYAEQSYFCVPVTECQQILSLLIFFRWLGGSTR